MATQNFIEPVNNADSGSINREARNHATGLGRMDTAPTADASTAGALHYVPGADGVADQVVLPLKGSDNGFDNYYPMLATSAERQHPSVTYGMQVASSGLDTGDDQAVSAIGPNEGAVIDLSRFSEWRFRIAVAEVSDAGTSASAHLTYTDIAGSDTAVSGVSFDLTALGADASDWAAVPTDLDADAVLGFDVLVDVVTASTTTTGNAVVWVDLR